MYVHDGRVKQLTTLIMTTFVSTTTTTTSVEKKKQRKWESGLNGSMVYIKGTYFGEFGSLVEFSFQLRLVMWPSAKLSSRQNKFWLNVD